MAKLYDLITKGKEQGFLTRLEILAILVPTVKDEYLLNDIMLIIQALGIEIHDQNSEDKTRMEFLVGLKSHSEEVDKKFEEVRERIRKIEEKALRKLRKKKDDPDNDPEMA